MRLSSAAVAMTGRQTSVAALTDTPVRALIADQTIQTVFQPVVHLASRSVVGFEALTRGPVGSPLESPMALLEEAQQAGLLAELDWLCRTRAMRVAADAGLPDQLSWLINVEPAGLAAACPTHLLPDLERGRSELRVILEVVERNVDGNVLDLIRATDQARRDAWGVALDDVGALESSLALLPFLRPDVVKLDMSLVRGAPTAAVADITAAVNSYAERRNAVILAEGIETEAEERLAVVLGAVYGQGYFYGRPGPLPLDVPVPQHPIPLRQHMTPLDGRTPYEALASKIAPRRGRAQDVIHIRTHLEQQATAGGNASVLLAGFGHGDDFTETSRLRYDKLAQVNTLTVVLAERVSHRDEPRYTVAPIPAGSRMADERVIIVLHPHYAAAFALRETTDPGRSDQRTFDFVYTHDRELVIDAARRFVQFAQRSTGTFDTSATPALRAAAGPGGTRPRNGVSPLHHHWPQRPLPGPIAASQPSGRRRNGSWTTSTARSPWACGRSPGSRTTGRRTSSSVRTPTASRPAAVTRGPTRTASRW